MSRQRSMTSSSKIHIHHVHIADGFTDDCEELIHRWLKTNTLTYESFCQIWKDMQFNFLYHGRSSGAEIAELSEELLQIAKHYMVSNTDNVEESVVGLFLVYALLRLQPYPGFAALRVVAEDAPALTRLETTARRDRRYDVLYILAAVLIEGPVQYHAANRERGMETAIKKYLEGTTGIDRIGVRPKGVFYRQNEESDLLRELNSITKRYTDAKKAIGGDSRGLNYTDENLATELDSSLKAVINGIIEEGPEGNRKLQDHYSKVQEVREKAMRQAVHGVKHLVSISDRKQGSKTYDSDPDYVCPSSKRKRKHVSSSDDDPPDEDTDAPPSSAQPHSDDLNLDAFDKDKKTNNDEKEVDIRIDALPVFIRTEQNGSIYEIEVIDNFDQSQTSKNSDKSRSDVSADRVDPLGPDNYLPFVDEKARNNKRNRRITKKEREAKTKKQEERIRLREQKKESKEMLKKMKEERKEKNHILKKREKRELKKTALKSKFKRMGMLPVANFDDAKRKSLSETDISEN